MDSFIGFTTNVVQFSHHKISRFLIESERHGKSKEFIKMKLKGQSHEKESEIMIGDVSFGLNCKVRHSF
jgi:hypothetical protein